MANQGYTNIHDGKLFYRKIGTGIPIVFIHGFCLDHRMWQKQSDYFSSTHTCITYDLRGFGKSTLPITPYSHHDDLLVFLKNLHIDEPVILIALSMGGRAAVNFSLVHPAKKSEH